MNIRVDLTYPIQDGTEVVFRSPVDCSQITGLKVYYLTEDGAAKSQEFALADAHGNNVGNIDHLFAENVVVKVILDVSSGMAFVQNADTNAYLEARLAKCAPAIEKTGPVASHGTLEDFQSGDAVVGITAYGDSWQTSVPTLTNKAIVNNLTSAKLDVNDGIVVIEQTIRGIKNAVGEWVARDEIIAKDGKVTLIERTGEVTLLGTEPWQPGTSSSTNIIVGLDTNRISDADVMKNADMLCDYFKVIPGSATATLQPSEATNANKTVNLQVKVPVDVCADVNAWKAWLNTKAPKIVYIRNTPVETDITDTETGAALLGLLATYEAFSWRFDGDMSVTYHSDTTKALEALREDLELQIGNLQEEVDGLQEGMSRYYGVNQICTLSDAIEQNGITIAPDTDVVGKYTITGTSNIEKAIAVAIYNSASALPLNIMRGNAYRIGKSFPGGVSMQIQTTADGKNWITLGSVSRTNTKNIVIPDNAVGMRILLSISYGVGFIGNEIETEMTLVSTAKYAQELVNGTQTTPPPMITIIDDDGYKNFATLLKPIIERRKIPIASAIPIQEIETKPDKVMDWATIEACADAGAEILSHTYSNLGVVNAREVTKDANGKDVYGKRLLTDADIIHDYRLAQAQLRRRGLNGDGLVFVKDSSNLPECVSACKQVYSYGFKADPSPGINSTNPLINYKGSTDRYGILRNGATGATVTQLKEMAQALLDAGTGWLVLMLHTSTSTYNATQIGYLEEAIEYIQGLTDENTGEQLIQIVTAEHGARTYCD